MKRMFGICLFLICTINISARAKNDFYTFVYDASGKHVNEVSVKVSEIVWKNDNEHNLFMEDVEKEPIDIEQIISDNAMGDENIIIMDFRTDDEENPYPEIELMNVTVKCPSELTGGGRVYLGKDYRLIYFDENTVQDFSDNITEFKLESLCFNVNKLGKYVIYLNPDVYNVTFYLEEPIYDEDGEIINSECIYKEIKDLNCKEIVEFPTIPEKEGFVFTGWQCRTQSGRFYFSAPQPVYANYPYEYYTSWCPEDEYEPLKIEISSEESIIKGKEDGEKITLKTNFGIFADEDELNAETEYWNIIGSDNLEIDSITRIDDKTIELLLSGNSEDIYKSSDIQIEFDSCLLQWEKYDEDDNLIYEEDEVIQMDEDGVRAKMYRSDNSLKLSKQSRPGGGAGLGVPKYSVIFETNGGSDIQKQVISKNTVAKMPEVPQKDGCVFVGWYSDEEFENEYDFNSKVTKNITLYAKWEEADKTKDQIVFTVGKTTALIFGEEKENDVAPVICGERTYLPARFVAESLGAKVSWNSEKQEVTIEKDDVKIIIAMGEKTALVNGEITELDAPAFIENDRTYTPIRFVAEELGCVVEWNPDGGIITITQEV